MSPRRGRARLELLVAVVVLRDLECGDATRRRLVAAALLLPLLERGSPLEEAEVVDEELAVQMIDLVLKAPREQFVGIDLDRLSLTVLRLDDDAHRALDVGIDVWNREAALFALLRSFAQQDFRIDDDVPRTVDVDDGHALGAPHLRRGEPDALGGVHRLEHVVHELLELRTDLCNGARLLPQDRGAQDVNVEQTHDAAASVFGAMTRAMRPRSMTMRASPVLIVTRSSMALTG